MKLRSSAAFSSKASPTIGGVPRRRKANFDFGQHKLLSFADALTLKMKLATTAAVFKQEMPYFCGHPIVRNYNRCQKNR